MNDAIQIWVRHTIHSRHITGKTVLEIGSRDVNGTVRPYIESLYPAHYLGVDAEEGDCVDRIVDCETLTEHVGAGCWDVVITTEMLEHVDDWRTCMVQMRRALSPGGLLLITTRSPGFPYHEYPRDFWRYTKDTMRQILDALNLETLTVEDDPKEPGVFALAANTISDTFDILALGDITVEFMPQPRGVTAVIKAWNPLPE